MLRLRVRQHSEAFRSWLSRLLAPNLARCGRCDTSLFGPIRNERHETRYSPSSACFPLCERCWAELTPAERMPFYDELVDQWVGNDIAECRFDPVGAHARSRELIREAVIAGG